MFKDYYQQLADKFLEGGFELSIEETDSAKRPAWDPHWGGKHYRVTIRRRTPKLFMPEEFSFDFWGSIADKERGVDPSPYDVLACAASDAQASSDPDEIYYDYGHMPPSQCLAIAKMGQDLRDFFTQEELYDLYAINYT